MRKVVLAGALAALFAVAPAAQAQETVYVDDPTPGGTFTGKYQCGWETEPDPDNPGQYRYKLDKDGNKIPVYCTQKGYVSVGPNGVVACNGNPGITRPDNGEPLQGYVWIGSGNAASNPTGQTPGGHAGAGNNHEGADGQPTGKSPCPQQRANDAPPPQPKKARKAKKRKKLRARR